MHGGAAGSGAPKRNANAVTHGNFTREARAERKLIRGLVRDLRKYAGRIK
jgi:glucans biosynthesis protein